MGGISPPPSLAWRIASMRPSETSTSTSVRGAAETPSMSRTRRTTRSATGASGRREAQLEVDEVPADAALDLGEQLRVVRDRGPEGHRQAAAGTTRYVDHNRRVPRPLPDHLAKHLHGR